jgi:hypothetical protein
MNKKIVWLLFLICVLPFVYGQSTITRQFISDVNSNKSMEVTLQITIDPLLNDSFFIVDENITNGFIVLATDGSLVDEGHIKWVFLQPPLPKNITYILQTPTKIGIYNFTGQYMFQYSLLPLLIDGNTQVTVINKTTVPLGIFGLINITPKHDYIYGLNYSFNKPEQNFINGYTETQYMYWSLIDNASKIISGNVNGQEVFGNVNSTITINVPTIGKYALTVIITQINQTYNSINQQWINSNETIIIQDTKEIYANIISPNKPQPNGFISFLQTIIHWLKSLFAWLG